MLFQGSQKGPEKARKGLNSLQIVFSKELTRGNSILEKHEIYLVTRIHLTSYPEDGKRSHLVPTTELPVPTTELPVPVWLGLLVLSAVEPLGFFIAWLACFGRLGSPVSLAAEPTTRRRHRFLVLLFPMPDLLKPLLI